MSTKKHVSLEIISGLHAFLMCIGLYPFIAGLCNLEGMASVRFHAVGMLLLIPVFFSRILLGKIRNMILYLLSGILVSAAVSCAAFRFGGFFQNGNRILSVLTGILSVFIFCVHTYAKITYGRMKRDFQSMPGGNENFELREWEIPTVLGTPSSVHWIWFTILYLGGLFIHSSACLRVILYMALADVFLCFLYHYQYEFYRYIRENRALANLPFRTMERIHRVIGIMAVLLMILFTIPALLYGKEPLENIHLEQNVSAEQEPRQNDDTSGDVQEERADMAALTEGETLFEMPKWIRRLAGALLFLLAAAAVIIVLRMIYHAIQNAGALFAVEEEDEVLFLKAGSAEESSGGERKKTEREGWLSVNARIRRKYKKQIRKFTVGKPKAWATPTELEQQAGLCAAEDMRTLHRYYEKARYSEEGCTRGEYEEIK